MFEIEMDHSKIGKKPRLWKKQTPAIKLIVFIHLIRSWLVELLIKNYHKKKTSTSNLRYKLWVQKEKSIRTIGLRLQGQHYKDLDYLYWIPIQSNRLEEYMLWEFTQKKETYSRSGKLERVEAYCRAFCAKFFSFLIFALELCSFWIVCV